MTLDRTGVGSSREALYSTMRTVLDGVTHVALLEFPDHGNVGDSAIWLGERAILRKLGIDVAYAASVRTFDAVALRRSVGRSGAVVMHGGGSLGDVWPGSSRFKRTVVEQTMTKRIVFFPQTLHFESGSSLSELRRSLAAHPNLTLLARDARSAEVGQELGCTETVLCPDAAFALDMRRRPPEVDMLWLVRDDRESSGGIAPDTSAAFRQRIADWPPDPYRVRGSHRSVRVPQHTLRMAREVGLRAVGSRADVGRSFAVRTLDSRASRRLTGGLRLLSQGRVVVTDRLHGHILCMLADIPHVLADNSYGKVSQYVQTWGTYEPKALVESTESAIAFGRELLSEAL